jgi:hypothetical protein
MAGRELGPADGTPRRPHRPDERAFRELTADRDRLARELAEAHAQARWYEETLTAREAALDQARRTVDLLSATGPARAGRAFLGGVRAARQTGRAVLRRVRPPG